MDEEQGAQPEFMPAVEEILHNAGIEVRKIPFDEAGNMITLLRFHTPAKVYTVKLDDGGVNVLMQHLSGKQGPPQIVIAAPGDIPGLRP